MTSAEKKQQISRKTTDMANFLVKSRGITSSSESFIKRLKITAEEKRMLLIYMDFTRLCGLQDGIVIGENVVRQEIKDVLEFNDNEKYDFSGIFDEFNPEDYKYKF